MTALYQAIFTSGKGGENRRRAETSCIDHNMRLEDDDLIYNCYGVVVARYLGANERGELQFENVALEQDWFKAKILKGEG